MILTSVPGMCKRDSDIRPNDRISASQILVYLSRQKLREHCNTKLPEHTPRSNNFRGQFISRQLGTYYFNSLVYTNKRAYERPVSRTPDPV
jgi:uncharacterized protein (DUF2164 family)